jgi:hypothetical protein
LIASSDLFFKKYTYKNEFYGDYEEILNYIWSIGLIEDTIYLLWASIWELIDNAFSHNLWRWDTWPLVYIYIKNNIDSKKLEISIIDLWVWFSWTLKEKYLLGNKNEENYIEIWLKPGVTGRYQNKWWNWLVFLQQNIFNWFKGDLFIRSNDTLVWIPIKEKIKLLKKYKNQVSWVHVYFVISY